MHRKGRFKAFGKNTAILYRPLDPNEQETPFSREIGVLWQQTRGRFREESVFEGGQRDTPTPTHSTFYPGSLDDFGICHNIRVASDRGSIFGTPTHTRERAMLPALCSFAVSDGSNFEN